MNRFLMRGLLPGVAGTAGAAMVLALTSSAAAQVVLSRSVVGAGGAASGGSMTSTVTVGQSAIGVSQGALMTAHHGFWSGGAVIYSTVAPEIPVTPVDLPTRVALGPPWPNPTRGQMQFDLALPTASFVRVTVLDVTGRLVTVAHEGSMEPGHHRIAWDGRGTRGTKLSGGVYYARLEVDGRTADRQSIVIVK
jgi:hypothetical protein